MYNTQASIVQKKTSLRLEWHGLDSIYSCHYLLALCILLKAIILVFLQNTSPYEEGRWFMFNFCFSSVWSVPYCPIANKSQSPVYKFHFWILAAVMVMKKKSLSFNSILPPPKSQKPPNPWVLVLPQTQHHKVLVLTRSWYWCSRPHHYLYRH